MGGQESVIRSERRELLVGRIGALVDEQVDKHLRQIELRQEVMKLDDELERLQHEISGTAKELIQIVTSNN